MGDISKQNSTGQNRRAAQEATQQDYNKLHLAHGIIGKIREKQEGSGSLEKESPVCIVAIEKEEKTRGRSISIDLEKDNVMRTKRARR